MSGVKVIRALLVANAALVALVPAEKIFVGAVKQGAALPTLLVSDIVTTYQPKIDAQAAYSIATSRVQITAMGKDYPGVKSLIGAVRRACNFQRGAIAGVPVITVVCAGVGPDFSDDDSSTHFQSIDFKVTYHEAN